MIIQAFDTETFLEVCDKLNEIKDRDLSESSLLAYMVSGNFNHCTFTYVSHDLQKMNGCCVVSVGKGIGGEMTLFLVFLWIDKHYPRLWKDFMEFIEMKAKEWNVKKISITTNRNAHAIERKYGKYGYKHCYSVIEKKVE
jgi:hypothetical protein